MRMAGGDVFTDDDAAEERVDERAEAGFAADELGRDADDALLLGHVHRVDVADGIEREELGTPAALALEHIDGAHSVGFGLDHDSVETRFEGGTDREFEARRNAKLAREDADDAGEFGWLTERAGVDAVNERVAHEEDVAGADSDAVVLGVDALESVEAAFERVEFAQVQLVGARRSRGLRRRRGSGVRERGVRLVAWHHPVRTGLGHELWRAVRRSGGRNRRGRREVSCGERGCVRFRVRGP